MLNVILYLLAIIAVGIISTTITYFECRILDKIYNNEKRSKKEAIEKLSELDKEGKLEYKEYLKKLSE